MTTDPPRRKRQPISDAMAAAGFLVIAILATTQIIAGVALFVMIPLLIFGVLAGTYYTAVAIRGFRAGIAGRRDDKD